MVLATLNPLPPNVLTPLSVFRPSFNLCIDAAGRAAPARETARVAAVARFRDDRRVADQQDVRQAPHRVGQLRRSCPDDDPGLLVGQQVEPDAGVLRG